LSTTFEIGSDVFDELMKLADESQVAFDGFEGVLLDNYILYGTENISLAGESSKFIILKEKFLNNNSSVMVAIMTDSEDEVDEYKAAFENL
jgi:hypothetical protein